LPKAGVGTAAKIPVLTPPHRSCSRYSLPSSCCWAAGVGSTASLASCTCSLKERELYLLFKSLSHCL